MPLGHDGFANRVRDLPFSVCASAENVAYNYSPEPAIALDQWQNSEGHRLNMLGPYEEAGVARACTE